MYLSTFSQSLTDNDFKLIKRITFGYPHSCSKIFDAWLWAHPNNVIHIHIITEKVIFSFIYIQDSCISGVCMTEKIQERAVLSVFICIIWIVAGSFIVP